MYDASYGHYHPCPVCGLPPKRKRKMEAETRPQNPYKELMQISGGQWIDVPEHQIWQEGADAMKSYYEAKLEEVKEDDGYYKGFNAGYDERGKQDQAHEQARVERIIKKIQSHWLEEHWLGEGSESGVQLETTGKLYSQPLEERKWWTSLKKREGIEK